MKTSLRIHIRSHRGFTLIEVMVVVAIIAILGSIAYPSYIDYVIKTQRGTAKSMLTQVATKQEQFFLDNRQYSADLTQLRYLANPFFVDKNGNTSAASTADSIYEIRVNRPTTTTYTLRAVPVNRQLTQDTKCGTFTLTHRGERGIENGSGTVNDCW